MEKNRVVVVSFASNKYLSSQAGLVESARAIGFRRFMSYNLENLPTDWRSTNAVNESVRGCGYWLWKPLIIRDALHKAEADQLVLYVDAGNRFLASDFGLLLEVAGRQDVTLFDNRDSNPLGRRNLNLHWTKRDCFQLLGCDTPEYWFAPQVNASYQIYRRTDYSFAFIEEYLRGCLIPAALNDEPSQLKNLEGFRDHRHDQSILSILAHKHLISLLPDPSDVCVKMPRSPFPTLFNHHRGKVRITASGLTDH